VALDFQLEETDMTAYEKLAEQLAEAEAAGNTERAERLRAALVRLLVSAQGGGTGSGSGGPGNP